MSKKKTVCIQLLNTLVKKAEIQNIDYIKQLKTDPKSYKENYILVKNHEPTLSNICCDKRGTSDCFHDQTLYEIKPFAIELMNSTRLMYEFICFSELERYPSNQIINHLEDLMLKNPNKQVKYLNSYPMRGFKRDIFFSKVVTQEDNTYIITDEFINHPFFNPQFLLLNRFASKVYILASDTKYLSVASISGFCIIPITN